MQKMESYTLNLQGRLLSLARPVVMGIVNSTPDSFYSGSRVSGERHAADRARQISAEGGEMIDVGAYSTRPGAPEVSEAEEWERLKVALEGIRSACPDAVLSVDTFRAEIARKCVEQYNANIINDISGGEYDPELWQAVAELRVPYVLMHTRGNPQTMQQMTDYADVTAEVLESLAFKTAELRSIGVSDVIIDPGFGFAKTLEQNYEMLANLQAFKLLEAPLLVGVSRKSMIFRALGITPDESANGTTVINTIALQKGADILRVHDVRNAVEAVRLMALVKADKCGET